MANADHNDYPDGRPRSVTIVIWGFLIIGALNIWRVVGLWQQSDLLLEIGVTLDPRLRAFGAGFWAIVFVVAAVAVARKIRILRVIAPAILLGYALHQLAVPWLFSPVPVRPDGFLFNGLLYLVAILLVAWFLNRSAARRYFEAKM